MSITPKRDRASRKSLQRYQDYSSLLDRLGRRVYGGKYVRGFPEPVRGRKGYRNGR